MNDLPSMWREELWHPKVVHFGVALLIVGTALYIAFLLFRKKGISDKLLFSARVCLGFGVLSAFASVVTGNMADSVVGRQVCDPLVLEAHCYYAHLMTYIYTASFGVDLGLAFVNRDKLQKMGRYCIAVALVVGAVLVVYVGHLGGKLVYQQAAGVHVPGENCEEFQE